jgi:thioredoxin 1
MSEIIQHINQQEFTAKVEKGAGVFVVDFWAPWCGPCRMLAPILEQLAVEYQGKIEILKVNVDENNDLANKFGITGIPTLIVFKGSKAVDQLIGMAPKQKLSELIAKHIG